MGKVLIIRPEIAAADKPSGPSREVVLSIDQGLLKEALEKVNDPLLSRRFGKGMAIIEAGADLRRALAFIDQGTVQAATDAVVRQAAAIETLKEIERALSSDDDEPLAWRTCWRSSNAFSRSRWP